MTARDLLTRKNLILIALMLVSLFLVALSTDDNRLRSSKDKPKEMSVFIPEPRPLTYQDPLPPEASSP